MANRVLMIGLDGASPALVKRRRAYLPNLWRLMENGAWGVLRSTIPHYTLPAWPSMVTGVHPGKSGFYGFRRLPGSYRFAFNSLSNSPALTVWDILTQEERSSGVVGLPGTFPPQKLNGFIDSGFPAPANSGRLTFTYPEELSGELNDRFGLYESQAYEPYIPGKEQNFIDAWRQLARSHWEATT